MSGDLGGSISQAWSAFLGLVDKIVSPDWGALVLLIPLAVVPLVLLHLLVSGGQWTRFGLTRPRPRIRWQVGAHPMELDAGGAPVPPVGLPFSLRTRLVYPFGTVRTDDGEDLVVVCPMCHVERSAQIPRCGNCGLALDVRQAMIPARPSGPPPGGAAIA